MAENELNIEQILNLSGNEELLAKALPFQLLMMRYNSAMLEVKTKFEVLDSEFSVRYNYNPIENIKTRLKTPISIADKLKRRNIPVNLANMRDCIFDIAGVRVVCSYSDDIYALSEMFLRQNDVTLKQRKDYIKNPKPNGYRSLHLIVNVPVFLTDATVQVPVEVQFRTIAMDFWASLEHKTKYKKDIENADIISSELKMCAEQITAIDEKMLSIRKRLQKGNGPV